MRRYRRIGGAVLLALSLCGSAGAAIVVPPPSEGFSYRMPFVAVAGPKITPGQVCVKLRPEASLDAFLSETGLTVLDTLPQIGVEVLSVPVGSEAEAARTLSARGDVLFAETDKVAHEMNVPNDAYFLSDQWYLRQANLPAAWDVSTGSSSVVIAILDTGVNLTHPDLQSKLLPGYNAVNSSATVNDADGHGSHVSGLAAAASNNGIGIAGVSWGAKILPIKVLGSNGEGSDSNIGKGIMWAADSKAWVISMSLGGEGDDATLDLAAQYAQKKGCLLVAAAGNEYQTGNPVEYPAAIPGVMAVGASTNTDERASYSNSGNYLSVLAPGGDPTSDSDPDSNHWILSASLAKDGYYEYMAGTSQATPQVSGLAALLWSIRPDYLATQIRQVIESSAKDLETPGYDNDTGYGRIDAEAAVKALLGSTTPGDVNTDGKIDVLDASLVLQAVVGLATVSLSTADVAPVPGTNGKAYGDGQVTVEDAIRILKRAVGLEPDPWPG